MSSVFTCFLQFHHPAYIEKAGILLCFSRTLLVECCIELFVPVVVFTDDGFATGRPCSKSTKTPILIFSFTFYWPLVQHNPSTSWPVYQLLRNCPLFSTPTPADSSLTVTTITFCHTGLQRTVSSGHFHTHPLSLFQLSFLSIFSWLAVPLLYHLLPHPCWQTDMPTSRLSIRGSFGGGGKNRSID